VAAIIRVERTVLHFLPATGLWERSSEISFYLSSRPITAKTAAAAVRQHWRIENTSHHSRDVTFREDASRIRAIRTPASRSRTTRPISATRPISPWTSRATWIRQAEMTSADLHDSQRGEAMI
jgi:hypothetical protein